MKALFKFSIIIICAISVFSCEKEKIEQTVKPALIDTLEIAKGDHFLFNIPIDGDTILIDKDYGIDFRVAMKGFKIDSVKFKMDDTNYLGFDTTIISTYNFYNTPGIHQIEFLLKTLNLEKGDTVFFKSGIFNVKYVANLSQRYIKNSIADGKLKIVWPELDKENTQHYLIERSMKSGFDYKVFTQKFEVSDSIFIDSYYVGEGVNYKISVINKQGGKQIIWDHHKEREDPIITISQNLQNGFNINFSSCKYYNNFGKYIITTPLNANPKILYTTSLINDTTYNCSDAMFAGEARYWIRCLPKNYPEMVTDVNWDIYGHYLYGNYGIKSFKYDRIAQINANTIAYTRNGHIYKYDVSKGETVDSIVNKNARYDFLRTSPSGKYLSVMDEKLYGSPVYIWATNQFTEAPQYTFQTEFYLPPMSDILTAVMGMKSNTTDSKIAIFDATTGNILMPTTYPATSNSPTISANGQFMFINDGKLKLCNYSNNKFKVIWEETDWTKYYRLYNFDPTNPEICYTWDDKRIYQSIMSQIFQPLKHSNWICINSLTWIVIPVK